MKTTTKPTRASVAVALAVLVAAAVPAGCGEDQRSAFLYVLGAYTFGFWILSVGAIISLHKLHSLPWFIELVNKARMPATVLGVVAGLVGVWLTLSGLPDLVGAPGPAKLRTFLGLTVAVAAVEVLMWARADSAASKGLHIKIAVLSAAYAVSLWYIIGGAGLVSTAEW